MIRILASGINNNSGDCQCDHAELKALVTQAQTAAEKSEKAAKECEEISKMMHYELMKLKLINVQPPKEEEVDPPIVEVSIYDEPIVEEHIVEEPVIKSSGEEVVPVDDAAAEDADAVIES